MGEDLISDWSVVLTRRMGVPDLAQGRKKGWAT